MKRHKDGGGPAFICAGPERTGTSWLHENLSHHPDVFLPPVKELRYFWEVFAYPDETWRGRFSAKGDWHARDYRWYLKVRARSYLRHPAAIVRQRHRFMWDCRFLFGHRDDRWYLSLFDDAGDRLAGDISPQYFALPAPRIDAIRDLLPGMKVVILLRDPIDWSWSFARMNVVGARKIEDVPDVEPALVFRNGTRSLTRRQRRSANGRAASKPENIHFGFHDLLCSEPETFFREICTFLKNRSRTDA